MNQKYLYVTEDGQFFTGDVFTEAEQAACDDGLLDVVHLDAHLVWVDGEWTPLLNWDE